MQRHIHYFRCDAPLAARNMSNILSSYLNMQFLAPSAFVLLCIGTDRVTGDSLGPLIGYKLSKQQPANVYVYGTLHDPVHALNLHQVYKTIRRTHPALPVVAIDASLGKTTDTEQITLCTGALCPGSGVDKNLPAVGDVSITGVVSTLAGNAQAQLSATRLDTVMRLADVITDSIRMAAATLAP